MKAVVDRDLTRRSLLQALVATIAALPMGWTEIAVGAAAASVLSAAEAADVEAVAAQIIPSDDTPGAREAGVVSFIDRALATFLSQLAGDYRAQLAAFQAAFRERQPGVASFASLASAQQIAYLRTVDDTPFFEATRLLTVLGMFSQPTYGGNRNGAGWKLLGFEDRHFFQPPFGHYDRGYPGFVIEPAKIQ